MKKLSYRAVALTVAVVLLITSVLSVVTLISFAEEVSYTGKFAVSAPYSLTDLSGDASTVKLGIADDLPSAAPGKADHRRLWWGNGDFIGNAMGYTDSTVSPVIPADDSIPLAGYNIQTADGSNGASGMVTYHSRFALKDIRFDTSYSTDNDYWISKPFTFYVSKDGVTFTKLNTTLQKVGCDFTRNVCNGMNSQMYDTASFDEEDDIHYVRIVCELKVTDNNFAKEINRIYAIDYNAYVKEISYTEKFTVNVPYSLTDLSGNASTVKMGIADDLPSAAPGKSDHRRLWWGNGDFVGNPTGFIDSTVNPAVPADESIPLAGYNIQKADGTNGASGIATYYSQFALKDVRFDTSYSTDGDYWISKPLTFYASKDGVTFNKITTFLNNVGTDFTRNVCNGMNSQMYDTASFEEKDDIHYIRIVCELKVTDNNFAKEINRIYAIDYNTYRETVNYTHSINPNSYYSISGDTESKVQLKKEGAVANTSIPSGYCLMNEQGTTVVDGEVVYDSLGAFKNVRFDTAYQIASDKLGYWWAKPLEFYASKDGVTYNKVETLRIVGDKSLSDNFQNTYAHTYDEVSFAESDDIHYLKIKIDTESASNPYIPRIFAVDYTSFADKEEIIPIRYQNEVNITTDSTEITIECDEGVELDSPKRFNGGWGPYHMYTFHKGLISSEAKPENNATGSVIIKSFNNKPITDWEFGGICGTDPAWSGEFIIYGSADGETWRRLEYSSEKGNIYLAAFGAYEYAYRGNLSTDYGIKYIKVSTTTGIFAFLPSYRYMLYSTEGYDSVNFKPADKYVNRMKLDNYYQKGEDYYLFRTGTDAVDFDLHVTEPISETHAIEVTVNSATEDYEDDYLKTAMRVLVKNNGDGTGEYRYYNSFYNSRRILFVKVKLNSAEFLYLDYNLVSGLEDTLRRHYDDVPIAEPIEDLTLKSETTKFCDGEQKNIALIENGTLNFNGGEENAKYIGDAMRGFLSSDGSRDYSVVMETPYVNDFSFRYAYSSENSVKIRQIKAYARSEWDGEETEIPLIRHLDPRYLSAGYKNYIYRPADRSKLPACEFHWVRIEVLCETFDDYSELLEFTYFYDIPKIEGMPELEKSKSGLNTLHDSFESPMLSKQNGGMADEVVNLKWVNYKVGYNGNKNIIMQDVFGAESYIVYQCDGIKGFDIRAYKQKHCSQDLKILASSDGIEWTEVKTEYLEKTLLSNWRGCSYKASEKAIPDNTNYLQVYFNEEIDSDEIMVSDVQLFYTGERANNTEIIDEEPIVDDTDTDTDNYDGQSKNAVVRRKKLVTRRTVRPIALVLGGVLLVAVIGGIATLVIVLIKKKKRVKQG